MASSRSKAAAWLGALAMALLGVACLSDPQPQPDPGMVGDAGGSKDQNGGGEVPTTGYEGKGNPSLVKVSAPDPETGEVAIAGLPSWIHLDAAAVVQVVDSRTHAFASVDTDRTAAFGATLGARTADTLQVWVSDAADQGNVWSDAVSVLVPQAEWTLADGGVPDVLAGIAVSAPDADGLATVTIDHPSLGPAISGAAANLDRPSADDHAASSAGLIQLRVKASSGDRAAVFLLDTTNGAASPPVLLLVP